MLWQALRHWDRAKIEPTIVFLSAGPFEQEVRELGFATEVIPAGRLRQPTSMVRSVRRLAAVLSAHHPELLLNWSAKAHIYGRLAATISRGSFPVVWWQHMIPDGHWVDRIATLLPADAIGCCSGASQQGQQALRPVRPTFVVNPGVEIPQGPPSGVPGLRAELGIPEARLVIGIVGRLQPWKGQDRFLAAIADLRARGRDVHGLIVGGDAYGFSPEYAAGLKALVPELGLEDSATLTGQVPEAASYLGLMDVAVNASADEPFGIVLIEAMAAGVPVVAVANGGPLDIVDPGVNGMLARSADSGDLADAIDEVIADEALRVEMGEAGRRRCEERFTAHVMSDRMLARLSETANA